jgi:hypothetical protein
MSASIPTPEPEKFRPHENLKDRFVSHPDGVTALNVCPRCKHDRVQVEVIEYLESEEARSAWNGAEVVVQGACPDCNLGMRAGVSMDAVDAYRDFHVAMERNLKFVLADQATANLENEIERFTKLLELDIVLPEDFA